MQKLESLRQLLKAAKGDAVLIPQNDQFQGEYISERDERLAWLSGFTGSAGFAIVTQAEAALFVDGRYTLQAHQQAKNFSTHDLKEASIKSWIENNLKFDDKIIIDPWLMTTSQWKRWQGYGRTLITSPTNLIDQLWVDRPPLKPSQITLHNIKYTGEESTSKVNKFRAFLKEQNLEYFILNKPENICWLLNIRGFDIPFTPLVNSFAVIGHYNIYLFVKEGSSTLSYLNVDWYNWSDFLPFLQTLEGAIGLDPAQTPKIVDEIMPVSYKVFLENPCIQWQAQKNVVEQEEAKQAHLYDGIAVCEFLAWLNLNWHKSQNEFTAAEYLLKCRQKQPLFKEPSFNTISAMGSNGAIVHYKPNKEQSSILTKGVYLIDSGGQYLCGTTDITRTIFLGDNPSKEQCENYTSVLKGHIALASIMFPPNTTGGQLDVLARQFLWKKGLDYAHGTGHGVGSYLSVHEGPQGISGNNNVHLVEGMILSNEPGYYKNGDYGIRLENLVLVQKSANFNNMLCFLNLTLVPFEPKLILKNLLNEEEINWINSYHKNIQDKILPHLTIDGKNWLMKVTEEI